MNSEKPRLIVGLMSGTSVDSVDAALCRVSPPRDGRMGAELVAFHEHPMREQLRERLLHLFQNSKGSLALACSLHAEVAEEFAMAAKELLAQAGVAAESVDIIASHGQTVWHIAPEMVDAEHPEHHAAATIQLGDGSLISLRTGIPVVCNFRMADMAVGGQGAPLVPFADWNLFSRPDRSCAVLNIGGIANVTFLPAGAPLSETVAFDTGPGNMVIDGLVSTFFGKKFDEGGRYGAKGRVAEGLLDGLMGHPFLGQFPPKSTGREIFGAPMIGNLAGLGASIGRENLVATATRLTARSIAEAIRRFWPGNSPPPDTLYVGGGGGQNPTLMQMLADELAENSAGTSPAIKMTDEAGVPAKARECIAFAMLGAAFLDGIPGNVPRVTGASRPVVLGMLADPLTRYRLRGAI